VLVARPADELAEAAVDCVRRGGETLIVALDVTDADRIAWSSQAARAGSGARYATRNGRANSHVAPQATSNHLVSSDVVGATGNIGKHVVAGRRRAHRPPIARRRAPRHGGHAHGRSGPQAARGRRRGRTRERPRASLAHRRGRRRRRRDLRRGGGLVRRRPRRRRRAPARSGPSGRTVLFTSGSAVVADGAAGEPSTAAGRYLPAITTYDGVFELPGGDGRTAFVDTRDIAGVGACWSANDRRKAASAAEPKSYRPITWQTLATTDAGDQERARQSLQVSSSLVAAWGRGPGARRPTSRRAAEWRRPAGARPGVGGRLPPACAGSRARTGALLRRARPSP